MKKIYFSIIGVITLLLFAVSPLLLEGESVEASEGMEVGSVFVCNDRSENLPEEFWENQEVANKITNRFYFYLNEKYGLNMDDEIYTVNGISAKDYPVYFAGSYINTSGNLVVRITEKYYNDNFKNSDWYHDFTEMVNSSEFICQPAKYSYGELINAISDITMGNLSRKIASDGAAIVDAGINDYKNVVEVGVHSIEDYNVICNLANSDIYEIRVVDYYPEDTIGLYAGEGVTNSSTGGYTYSVACRARRLLSGGKYKRGILGMIRVGLLPLFFRG